MHRCELMPALLPVGSAPARAYMTSTVLCWPHGCAPAYPATLLSCNLDTLLSCCLAILLSLLPAILPSCYRAVLLHCPLAALSPCNPAVLPTRHFAFMSFQCASAWVPHILHSFHLTAMLSCCHMVCSVHLPLCTQRWSLPIAGAMHRHGGHHLCGEERWLPAVCGGPGETRVCACLSGRLSERRHTQVLTLTTSNEGK